MAMNVPTHLIAFKINLPPFPSPPLACIPPGLAANGGRTSALSDPVRAVPADSGLARRRRL